MVNPGPNPKDSLYDPFTYLMFGQSAPPQNPYGPPQGYGVQSPPPRPQLLKPFMDQNGQIDFAKMMSSATQFVNVLQQTAPAIKQLSPLLKFFKRP
ncbi:MAG: YppG family protein [Sporolactobacillus sp.]|jgi:hypothetical protein|nr:YppG family protein [Sporolactobacillus sp.]